LGLAQPFFFYEGMMKNIALKCFIALGFLGIFACLFTTNTLSVDGFEHLKMSYLVANGYVPYRDFFEHHHPLLWYIYAPLIYILPHNITQAYYVSRIFSLIGSVIMLFIIGKTINRFLGGKQNTLCFLVILFMFFPTWHCFSTLKPDIIARIFYFAGIYYFFRYTEKFQTSEMVYCGLSFTFAFLALQNIVFSILPLIIPVLFLYEKHTKIVKDVAVSSVIPAIIIFTVILILIISNTWESYFQLNWIFNAYLFDYMHYTNNSVLYYWMPPILLGIGAWIWQVKQHKSSFYMNTVGLLLIAEIVQHIYYKAVFHHYLIIMFIFVSVLLAPVVSAVKNKFLIFSGYIIVVVTFCFNLNYIYSKDTKIMPIINSLDFAESDQVFNFDFRYINIYASKISYYSLFHAATLIDNTIFNRYPDYNTDEFIETNKIKYIDYIYTPQNNNIIFEGADNLKRFYISESTLSKYDEIYPGLWRRKAEYE